MKNLASNSVLSIHFIDLVQFSTISISKNYFNISLIPNIDPKNGPNPTCSCASTNQLIISKNDVPEVKVLAGIFLQFTYFEPTRGFFDGIDIQILKATKMDLKLVFAKVDNLSRISLGSLQKVGLIP